jgi:hypothetical protein
MTYGVKYVEGDVPAVVGAQLILKGIPDGDADGSSLRFYRNGLLMRPEFNDYTVVAGQIIIPNPPPDPQDKFIAFYRLKP